MDNGRRSSHHSGSSQTSSQGQPSLVSFTNVRSLNCEAEPTLPPSRNEFCRNLNRQRFDSRSTSHRGHQEQQSSSRNPQVADTMHGVESHYQAYLQEGGRPHHFHSPSENHQYPVYVPGAMLPPVQQSTIYEPVMNYQARSSQAFGPVHSQFSIPQYLPSIAQNTFCVGEENTSQYITSQPTQSPYESIPSCRSELVQSFSAASGAYGQTGQASAAVGQEQEAIEPDRNSSMSQYERQLKTVFDAIVAGGINEASDTLLAISRWLLSSVAQLGLHYDNEVEYDHRLAMWREFNHCWEALAFKQKSIVEDEIRTKRIASDKLTPQKITVMIDELVSLCDQVEEFGLVDYEMGVWEEQIISAFILCLDLQGHDKESLKLTTNK